MKYRKLNPKQKIILIITAAILITAFTVYCHYENNTIEISHHQYRSAKVPQGFDGFKICQISDLHNKSFGENNSELLSLISAEDPDMIVITGDLIDSRWTNVDIAKEFIDGAVEIAPVYYVMGNHESRIPSEHGELRIHMWYKGVKMLDNETVTIESDGEIINLHGAIDYGKKEETPYEVFGYFGTDNDILDILLVHKPDFLEEYSKNNFDMVFSGHLHAGQFNLPIIRRIVLYDYDHFPDHVSGMNAYKDMAVIVSRGLGNSLMPIRINNNPELVFCTLLSDETDEKN